MNLARVVGRVVSTHKDEGLTGRKLLILRAVDASLNETGPSFIAADAAGAGAAEVVVYVRGREASHAFLPDRVPADASVIGIVDAATMER